MADTAWDIVENQYFKSAGMRIIWKANNDGDTRCTNVYTPDPEALRWDGVTGMATHAIGSRYGGYVYVRLVTTGRKVTKGPAGAWGTRAKLTFIDMDENGAYEGSTVTAWIIDPVATQVAW